MQALGKLNQWLDTPQDTIGLALMDVSHGHPMG
jgi:hypothetical protein